MLGMIYFAHSISFFDKYDRALFALFVKRVKLSLVVTTGLNKRRKTTIITIITIITITITITNLRMAMIIIKESLLDSNNIVIAVVERHYHLITLIMRAEEEVIVVVTTTLLLKIHLGLLHYHLQIRMM